MGAKTLAELRAIPGDDLTARAGRAGFAATAIVDGTIILRQLIETFERGEQAPVPLMTGLTAGEIGTMRSILPGLPDPSSFTAASYEARIRANYGPLADAFLRLYPADAIGPNMLAAARDGFFAWHAQRLVREQARLGQAAYLYYFDHGTPAADEAGIHAFHASEVPYMFGTIDRVTPLWPAIPDTREERALSDAMVDYWSSFARTGAPRAPGQPDWPPHHQGAAYMIFAGTPRVAADLMPDAYRLHDAVICRRRAAGTIPWNWNVGVIAPPLPPAAEGCE
jgi:para-nitrobenzyl esterase